MSHAKERAEKICLNCGANLYGRYCHQCGQENIEPKESFLHLVKHFFYDITHFDGKFFETVKDLLLKPGFLSSEYMAGKRASYLNPIRMYVFTSAFFFLIFFSLIKPEDSFRLKPSGKDIKKARDYLLKERADLLKQLKKPSPRRDTAEDNKLLGLIEQDLVRVDKDSTLAIDSLYTYQYVLSKADFNVSGGYKTLAEYDSAQNVLPVDKRDNWLESMIARKNFKWREKYGNDVNILKAVWNKFLHSIPQLLFVSLPFFALMLKLLYIRRKQFYYADHGIFSVHLYCAIFIILLIVFGINKLNDWLNWDLFSYLIGFITVFIFIYIFLAMKRFYRQGGFKTFIKYFILLFLDIIFMSLLMIVFFILTFTSV